MSVVCCRVCDNKIEIASDSIAVYGSRQAKGENLKTSKLVMVNDMIIGSVGYAEEASLFQIFCKTHHPNNSTVEDVVILLSEFSDWKRKKTGDHSLGNHNIIVFDGRAFVTEGYFVQEIKNYWAIGAGADFSLAALYMGATTKRAIEIACELSIYCEPPVVFYESKKE